MAAYISVGTQFADFDSLEHCIQEYEKENHVTFYKRDVRTIDKMCRRIQRVSKRKPISEERKEQLKYYSISYTCIYGGRSFKKKLSPNIITKPREKTKTYRQNCPARIRVLLSDDANYLKIVAILSEHNHVISEEINKNLPKQRRLAKEEEEKVTELLKLKVNRQLLLQQIREETGKPVTKKDLYNIAMRHKIPTEKKQLIANQSGTKNVERLIANQSGTKNVEIASLKVPSVDDTSSMTALTPLTQDAVIEGASISEFGATVIEDHVYTESALTEIGEIEVPRVSSFMSGTTSECWNEGQRTSDEKARLELLREIESKKLKIEEEKLLLKSTKVRLLEEQNQLLKQLIDKIK